MTTYDSDYEITRDSSGKIIKIINTCTGREVTMAWAYPVKVNVWGGVPETLHFSTAAERNVWMKGRDYCEKLPRRKVYSDMIQRKEGTAMKTITCRDEEYELTKVLFTWRDEQTVQEGILVHAASDKFHDGDAIYANGWSIDIVNDESDMETLLTSGDGTTYFHKSFDGTYHLDD